MAVEQFAGRGQQANSWLSEPGRNLTFSLLLNPVFLRPSQQFLLNKAVSVAVNEALTEIAGTGFFIKWPNDVYFGTAKAGGMLIENVISGSTWKHAVVGIGLNVNQREFGSLNATSIAKILHADYDLRAILSKLCSYIESWYLRLRSGHDKQIEMAYLSRLFRYREQARYRLPGGTVIDGTIAGVTSEGRLRLLTGGEIRLFDLKEIEFLID